MIPPRDLRERLRECRATLRRTRVLALEYRSKLTAIELGYDVTVARAVVDAVADERARIVAAAHRAAWRGGLRDRKLEAFGRDLRELIERGGS